MAGSYRFERQQWVPTDRDAIFEFFSEARNLEALTPAWLGFRILTPTPLVMRSGTIIDYTIRLGGFPMRWRTLIEQWDPPFQFTDVQERGPYALWRHTHRFDSVGKGTLLTDVVVYRLPFGPLGRIVHALTVRATIGRIFDYRYEQIRTRFGEATNIAEPPGEQRRLA